MLDETDTDTTTTESNPTSTTSTTTTSSSTRRRAAGRPAGPPAPVSSDIFAAPPAAEAKTPTATVQQTTDAPKKTARTRKATAKKAAPKPADETTTDETATPAVEDAAAAEAPPAKKPARKRAATRKTAAPEPASTDEAPAADEASTEQVASGEPTEKPAAKKSSRPRKAAATTAMFQAPDTTVLPALPATDDQDPDTDESSAAEDDDESGDGAPKRRRRSRGGRRRRKSDDDQSGSDAQDDDTKSAKGDAQDGNDDDSGDDNQSSGNTRRRRRRARAGESASSSDDDPDNTVVKVRSGRSAEDEITGVSGSTRLEAKKQRRREGREAGRRRAPIVSESEFLARRESVERQMVVREHPGTDPGSRYTQIAVLEDKVLVEHYVARESQTSLIGNVYLGKVQNVLPSMEAAFVDIGAGRNAVIYAGEVDWSGVENGKARKIEEALSPGQTILVQVSKDPIGQKGARLTSQISLPGRFLVYVPGGGSNGISRKLPDTERARLKALLKEVLPENAGVIVRTAAEGATEDQLTRDVAALKARWEDIEAKVASAKAPTLLYAEPDLVIKVVRDLFNEDFADLVVEGDDAWDNIEAYVSHVAPDLRERARRWERPEGDDAPASVFDELRIEEQIHKALDRKVWLPSGGSLIIDRTEAMTVVDVNTGKFTGSGGNLEETVTKNNLEAAEEIVRQLRLRDIGGIIVIDFIDMVLESNRDLVLRRLVECLGRDRTRHQVAEVTSLGLVQMTRKRIGTGLLESFSTDCDHCKGRGVVITAEPVEPAKDDGPRRGRRGGRGGGGNNNGGKGNNGGGNNGGGNNGGGGNSSGGGRGRGGRGNGGGQQDDAQDGSTPEQPKAEQPKAEQDTSEAPKAGQSRSEEPKAVATTTDEPAKEQPQVAEAPAEAPVLDAGAEATSAPEAPAASGADPVLTDEGDAP